MTLDIGSGQVVFQKESAVVRESIDIITIFGVSAGELNTAMNISMQGTNVVYDACNGHCLEFIYDNIGQPYEFYYDGTPYYYVINQQDDVEKILNSQGSELVTCIYNAWGKPISNQDTSSNQIGSINPIRYRGYYYDSETGFSFLRYFSAAFFFCFPDASGREKGHRI